MHPVTLVAFPLVSLHLAPLSLHLQDMLLVKIALVYSNWIMVAPVNMNRFELVTMNFSITNHEGASKTSIPPRLICDPNPVADEQVLTQFKDCFKGVGCFLNLQLILLFPQLCTLCKEVQRPSLV